MQQLADKTAEIRKLTKSTFKKFKRSIPYIAVMLVSVVLTGIIELIRYDWTWETITSAGFWASIGTTNVSAFLMALSATLMTSDNIAFNTSEGLGQQAFQVESAINEFRLKLGNDIDIFVDLENRKRKAKAWENKINAKLLPIKRTFKASETQEYVKVLNGELLVENASKRVQKRVALEKQIEPEYINENIEILKVRYYKITRRMIENGSTKQEIDGKLRNASSVIIAGLLPKFLFSMSILIFFSSFMYDFKENITWAVVLPILIKFLTLFYNYIYGRGFAPDYFRETTINNLLVRFEWITKYIDWKKKRNENNNKEEKLKEEKEKEEIEK